MTGPKRTAAIGPLREVADVSSDQVFAVPRAVETGRRAAGPEEREFPPEGVVAVQDFRREAEKFGFAVDDFGVEAEAVAFGTRLAQQ